jgi:hypothetical protein
MAVTTGALEHKTRANHYKGRLGVAMGGHLHLRSGADPALVFRAHPFFQRRYELQIRLLDIRSVTGGTGRTRMIVELSKGTSESFLVAGGTDLLPALEKARRAARRGVTVDRPDEDGPHYWATGTYDPERYYRETSGWSNEYREYVRDAYGDLDTYNANHPD